jgi:hypothetical protein
MRTKKLLFQLIILFEMKWKNENEQEKKNYLHSVFSLDLINNMLPSYSVYL